MLGCPVSMKSDEYKWVMMCIRRTKLSLYVQMSLIMLLVPVWQNDAFHSREYLAPNNSLRTKSFKKTALDSFKCSVLTWQILWYEIFNKYFAKVPIWPFYLLVLCQHQTFQMSALPSDATVLPFDALLRASKGLIAGYTLLWDLGSECLSGLSRILPIFRPIQMSKEPNNLNGKSETFLKGAVYF